MSRHVTTMTIYDVDHYTPERREEIIKAFPAHEREARAKGIPVLGSGKVFPIDEESIKISPFPIPEHWVQINGLDFGYDHPFGATNCAWDKDADVFYVCKDYSKREATPLVHAGAIRPWGDWIPCAWPHDGLQHDKGSGEELAAQYRKESLKMLPDRATFPDGGNGVEAGIMDMLDRMQTGRWKVFSTCADWFAEFRLYHRKNGLIVKLKDDVISSSRYAFMMRRYAVAKPKPKPKVIRPPSAGAGGWMA